MEHKKNRAILAILFIVLNVAFAYGDEVSVIGLLELPTVFGEHDPDGPPGLVTPEKTIPVPVRSQPSTESQIIVEITSMKSIEVEEFDYEAPAAVAYGMSDGWILVRVKDSLKEEFGWISPKHQGLYHPISNLLNGSLCYLTNNWNGAIYSDPNSQNIKQTIDTDHEKKDILIIQLKNLKGKIWLEIELLLQDHCEGSDPEVILKGWIPVHRKDGKRNVWFYSRGC